MVNITQPPQIKNFLVELEETFETESVQSKTQTPQ